MIPTSDLRKLALARIADAKVLLAAGRFDGAGYLCGYAVEFTLKARICKTLKWPGYPDDKKGYQTFKTHDLDMLLNLSGREQVVKLKLFAEWNSVKTWNPEMRYQPVGSLSSIRVQQMIVAAKSIYRKL